MTILGDSFFIRNTIFGEREILSYQTNDFGSIPQRVYKYLDLSSSYNRNSLIENYLWFSDPTTFNDPFDCKTPFAFHLLADDAILCRKYVEFHSLKIEPNLSIEDRRFIVDANIKRILDNKGNIDFLKKWENESPQDRLEDLKQFGVFCTCMINDNILLWSHYTNKHKGICLGLKVDKVFEKYYVNGDMGAGEIKYDKFPLLLPPFPDDNEAIIKSFQPIFLTKAPFWNYELEYRFLDFPCQDRKKPIDDILDSIYLGCDISPKDESFVKEVCQNYRSKIKLYKAEKAFFNYAIEFNEIAY